MSKNRIEICMGSSCFLRGNNYHLELIKNFLKENDLSAQVELVGKLCESNCKNGPIIFINQTRYEKIGTDELTEILKTLQANK